MRYYYVTIALRLPQRYVIKRRRYVPLAFKQCDESQKHAIPARYLNYSMEEVLDNLPDIIQQEYIRTGITHWTPFHEIINCCKTGTIEQALALCERQLFTKFDRTFFPHP